MLDAQSADLLATLERMTKSWTASNALNDITGFRAYAAEVFTTFAGRERDETAFVSEDISIGTDEAARPARLYRPAIKAAVRPAAPLPVVVFFHGGGWMLGDIDSYHGLVASLAVLSQSVFISVDYRLAPEHKFPAGLQDAIMATAWVADHAKALGIDANRLAVMGDSAGGNLAAAVTQHRIRYGGSPTGGSPIRAQYLLYPVLDAVSPHSHFPSRLALGDGNFFLTRDAIENSVTQYLGAGQSAADPRISPLLAKNLAGLMPTFVMVGSYDPLLDEANAYVRRLQVAGVESTLHIVEGGIHAFLSFGVLDLSQTARRVLADHIRRTFALPSTLYLASQGRDV